MGPRASRPRLPRWIGEFCASQRAPTPILISVTGAHVAAGASGALRLGCRRHTTSRFPVDAPPRSRREDESLAYPGLLTLPSLFHLLQGHAFDGNDELPRSRKLGHA